MTLRVFQNADDIGFEEAADQDPVQELELAQTSEVQELPVKRARFGAVRRLTLFFPDNFGGEDETRDKSDEAHARRSNCKFQLGARLGCAR